MISHHFAPGERDNSVGTWNPAWGPQPEIKRPPTPRQTHPKYHLCKAVCPSCPADDVLVWGPPASYICSQCGAEMVVTRVRAERKPPEVSIHVGDRYGRLVVQSIERHPGQKLRAACLCDCGTVTSTRVQNLRSGQTRSCGCLYRERNLSPEHPWRQGYKKGTPDV